MQPIFVSNVKLEKFRNSRQLLSGFSNDFSLSPIIRRACFFFFPTASTTTTAQSPSLAYLNAIASVDAGSLLPLLSRPLTLLQLYRLRSGLEKNCEMQYELASDEKPWAFFLPFSSPALPSLARALAHMHFLSNLAFVFCVSSTGPLYGGYHKNYPLPEISTISRGR